MAFGADGKPIDPSSISVMTGTTYDQEFAYEMEKLKVSQLDYEIQALHISPRDGH